MIISLSVIILAFTWLLYESDFLRIRLPVGTAKEPIKTIKLWHCKVNGHTGITSDGDIAFYQYQSLWGTKKNQILLFNAGITEPVCGWDWILNHEHPIIENHIEILAHNVKHAITLCDNPEIDYSRIMKDVCSVAFKANLRRRNGHKPNRRKALLTFNPNYTLSKPKRHKSLA